MRDRYGISLYFHDMGPGFDASPFGRVTSSRYWMAGLVAGGAVMVTYIGLHLVLGRVVRRFSAPDWRRVWLLTVLPLLVGIPAIVMTVNQPILPLANAAQVAAATLVALALALMLGRMAARQPLAYMLLLLDGFSLAGLQLFLITLEDFPPSILYCNTSRTIPGTASSAPGNFSGSRPPA